MDDKALRALFVNLRYLVDRALAETAREMLANEPHDPAGVVSGAPAELSFDGLDLSALDGVYAAVEDRRMPEGVSGSGVSDCVRSAAPEGHAHTDELGAGYAYADALGLEFERVWAQVVDLGKIEDALALLPTDLPSLTSRLSVHEASLWLEVYRVEEPALAWLVSEMGRVAERLLR